MKAKGKYQKAKGKSRIRKAAPLFAKEKNKVPTFCLLIFAFCLLISPGRAQEQININTAAEAELMRLPYVGQTMAQRIIEHRRKHGSFKRPQDIIIIKGLSAKRYRAIVHLIRI